MKKIIRLSLCLFVTVTNAQIIKSIGIKAGGTVSQHKYEYGFFGLTNSEYPESRTAVNVGIFGEFLNLPVFSIVGEVNYVQSGARRKYPVTDLAHPNGTGETWTLNLNNDYLNISAMGKVRLDSPIFTPYVLFGPKIDIEVNRSEEYSGVLNPDNLDKIRLGVKAGIGTEIKLFGINFLSEVIYTKDFGELYNTNSLRITTYSLDFRVGAFINL
jgi:hypothetical protein